MTLSPTSFEQAKLTFKPLKRSNMARKTPPRSKTPLKANPRKQKPKKKSKIPKTAKVQTIFNTAVKERGNWVCVRCKKDFTDNKRLLQCSHFWGVGFTATRFDFDNCDPLCYPCHYGQLRTGWEYNKQGEYRNYMIQKLGVNGYEALEQKARSFKKLADAKLQFLADAPTAQTDKQEERQGD